MTMTRTESTGLLQHARDLAERASRLDSGTTLGTTLETALQGENGVALVAGEPTGEALDAITEACDHRSWQVFVAAGSNAGATRVAEKLRRGIVVEHSAAVMLRTLPVKPCVAIVCDGDADRVIADLDILADALPDGALAAVIGAPPQVDARWRMRTSLYARSQWRSVASSPSTNDRSASGMLMPPRNSIENTRAGSSRGETTPSPLKSTGIRAMSRRSFQSPSGIRSNNSSAFRRSVSHWRAMSRTSSALTGLGSGLWPACIMPRNIMTLPERMGWPAP